MATIYKCDRCHKSSNESNFLTKVSLENNDASSYNSQLIINTEICSKCFRELKEWIEPQAVAMNNR